MTEAQESLQQRVEAMLRKTSWVDGTEVQVSVKGAVVTLKGEVDSAIEKRRARELAQETPGVEYVSDELKLRNWVKRPDTELAEEVRNRLLRDAYTEGTRVEVRANAGEIVLDGSVPDYRTKKAVEDVTWWTPGVIGVENLLLVTDEEFVDVSPLEVPGG